MPPLIETVIDPEDQEALRAWAWRHYMTCRDPHCAFCDRAGDIITELG